MKTDPSLFKPIAERGPPLPAHAPTIVGIGGAARAMAELGHSLAPTGGRESDAVAASSTSAADPSLSPQPGAQPRAEAPASEVPAAASGPDTAAVALAARRSAETLTATADDAAEAPTDEASHEAGDTASGDDEAADAPAEDPDAEISARLRPVPHPESGEFQDKDKRPRWERAKMPKGEWDRALASSDAAIAKAEPGSAEFARLMDVRIRLFFPPPEDLNWKQIESYKSSQYRAVLAEDLNRELNRGDGTRKMIWFVLGPAVALFIGLIGYLLYVLLSGPPPAADNGKAPPPPPGATQKVGKSSKPTPATGEPVVTAQPVDTAATATVQPAPSATTSAPRPGWTARPTATATATATTTATTPAPTVTATAPPAPTSGGLLFQPGKR